MLSNRVVVKVAIRLIVFILFIDMACVVFRHNIFHLGNIQEFKPNFVVEKNVNRTSEHFFDDAIEVYNDDAVSKILEMTIKKYSVDMNCSLEPGRSPWKIADEWVTPRHVIPEIASELGAVLNAITTAKMTAIDLILTGTQLKFNLTLEGGQRVIFKPKRYEREDIVEGLPWTPGERGFDRHNGEIVAFHLSRLLGFRRTPLCVGRKVNIEEELIPLINDTFFWGFYEKDGNWCVHGWCHICGKYREVCAQNKLLEGSVILMLPPNIKLHEVDYPWTRYKEKYTVNGIPDKMLCSRVENDVVLLLDIVDTSVFDYIIGNNDRYTIDKVKGFENSMFVMLDNANSFGDPFRDVHSILAPLFQCCRIRYSTWKRLQLLQKGVLSGALREVLKTDPIYPVVTEAHLLAMDRRLHSVVLEVKRCLGTDDMTLVRNNTLQE